MSSSKKYCVVCINERTCYLEEDEDLANDESGYCDECGVCGVCGKKLYGRVEWKVTSNGRPITLCRDVCQEHIDVSECPCSENVNTFVVKKYKWITNEQPKDLQTTIQEYPI